MATTIEAPEAGAQNSGVEAVEDRPDASDPSLGSSPAPEDRLTRILAGGDHKTTGRLYIGFSLLFGVLGLAATIAYQATGASESWASSTADAAFQLFTLGRFLIVLGFMVPFFLGLATLLVPLQVGANTIAFPRAATAAFWLWLITTAMLGASYLGNGGVGGGNKEGQMLALLSLAGMVIALLLGSICVAVTAIGLRAPNMAMDDVPFFSWAFLVATSTWLLTLPVWLANIALVFLDVRYSQPASFGAVADQWSQLSWLFTPPQVFAFVIPVLGIVGDSVVTLSGGARMRHRGTVLAAIGAFGFLCIGSATQPYFVPNVYTYAPVMGQLVLLLVPVLVLVGAFTAAMRHGRPRVATPAVAALAALLLLVASCIATTVLVVGRFSLLTSPDGVKLTAGKLVAPDAAPLFTWTGFLLLVSVALLGAVGGCYLWSTKVTGKTIGSAGGNILVLLAALGGLVAAVPLGAIAFANRWADLAGSARGLFVASSIGVAALLATAIGLAFALIASAQGRATEPADPWGHGQTLEWLASSPPPLENFEELPTVQSPEPLLDLAEAADEAADEGPTVEGSDGAKPA